MRTIFVVGLGLLVWGVGAPKADEGASGGIAARSYGGEALSRIIARSAHGRPVVTRPRQPQLPGLDQGSLRRISRFDKLIGRYSKAHDLDADLVRALIYVDSGGDEGAVSRRGAAGLMQLMPATARQLGVVDRFDPEENIAAGTAYLRSLLDRFHTVETALWAYNAGPGAVSRGKMPGETRRFVPKVLGVKRVFAVGRSG